MDNPYWRQLEPLVTTDWITGGPVVDCMLTSSSGRDAARQLDRVWGQSDDDRRPVLPMTSGIVYLNRKAFCLRYAWTITDPDTVRFVAENCRPAAVDPMAGSGYWTHLLRQAGVDVVASDLWPPGTGSADWHADADPWIDHVVEADAADAAAEHADRTLLLAWPCYSCDSGYRCVSAYREAGGRRIVYIGEGEGGCTGDDDLHDELAGEWQRVAEHRPVQWSGIHDYVAVYDRHWGGRRCP